jgi:hypothetical protein
VPVDHGAENVKSQDAWCCHGRGLTFLPLKPGR